MNKLDKVTFGVGCVLPKWQPLLPRLRVEEFPTVGLFFHFHWLFINANLRLYFKAKKTRVSFKLDQDE